SRDRVRLPGFRVPGARHERGGSRGAGAGPATMSAPVTVAFNRDRSRAAFRLFHPKGNILTREMVQALQSALESIEPNPHLKLITIEGDGPDFSFGASVPEHAPDEIARVLPEMHALIERLLDAPAVTAAVVRGGPRRRGRALVRSAPGRAVGGRAALRRRGGAFERVVARAPRAARTGTALSE